MVSVSVDDVRDVINVSVVDIPDAKVLKMIKRAEVTLELEPGKEIVRADSVSQSDYGLREIVQVYEELHNDNECMLRAKALLSHLKESAEYLTLRSTAIDYGDSPILAGDRVHVVLPNENVDADFRVLSIEYYVDGKTQT